MHAPIAVQTLMKAYWLTCTESFVTIVEISQILCQMLEVGLKGCFSLLGASETSRFSPQMFQKLNVTSV